VSSPGGIQSQQNIEEFWNARQQGVKSWRDIANFEWDLIRSLGAKARRQGDETFDKDLAALLRRFRESHSR